MDPVPARSSKARAERTRGGQRPQPLPHRGCCQPKGGYNPGRRHGRQMAASRSAQHGAAPSNVPAPRPASPPPNPRAPPGPARRAPTAGPLLRVEVDHQIAQRGFQQHSHGRLPLRRPDPTRPCPPRGRPLPARRRSRSVGSAGRLGSAAGWIPCRRYCASVRDIEPPPAYSQPMHRACVDGRLFLSHPVWQ